MKICLNSFNGCQVTERTRNSIANDQREITPKIYKAKLWLLCMTHPLIVLYNCMKFLLNSNNGCQLTEQTRNSIANDQREITPKISKAELWFLCMTHCLIVRYKCMKFQPNSFNSVQLTELTQNYIYLHYKGDNLNQRTNGPVNTHLITWPSKAQNIQNLEKIYVKEMTLTFNTHIPS